MGIVVYNEWQKERLPLGPSSAVDAADLYRRLCRRHTPHVKASARSSFSSSAQFAHPRCGAEDFFLWPPEGRGSRRQSPTGARTSSATWLRLRCYISAVLKQDHSQSLMDYSRCSRPCLALHRGALQLADEDLPPRGRRTLRRHRAQCQTALRGL